MTQLQYSRVYAGAISGAGAISVTIETSISSGIPRHTVVGLPGSAVRECLDRIWSALKSSDMAIPRGVITVNMAPADVQKHGSGFDLPIAMGLMVAYSDATSTEVCARRLGETAFVGELALDGTLRPVRGILPIVKAVRDAGAKVIVVPLGNAQEAAHVRNIRVHAAEHLTHVLGFVMGSKRLPTARVRRTTANVEQPDVDYLDVIGQARAIRALTVAAAGGHNALMIGPPGCGKTMLAERFHTILPSWSDEEALEASSMHSLKGLLTGRGILAHRPFRAPHHSVSRPGLLGGGRPIQPGEVSLAHAGVLFLDEFPEFPRSVLEALREPLESGHVVLSRVHGAVRYPASFQLLAAMNPCPCGYRGHGQRECNCSVPARMAYRSRISGPLLDRVDIHLELQPVNLLADEEVLKPMSSRDLKRKIEKARSFRLSRGQRVANARVSSRLIEAHVTEDAGGMLVLALASGGHSMRTRERVLRMARTVADLRGEMSISPASMYEALTLRTNDQERRDKEKPGRVTTP